ncbi:MAG TPA: hypothetical protein VGH19_09460 [Verrucomicrobiae bacterium]
MPSEAEDSFITVLIAETTESFRRSAVDTEGLKAAVFLFVNRARENRMDDIKMAEVLGICVARAGLSEKDEDFLTEYLEEIASLTRNIPPTPSQSKPWWKIGA